MLTEDDARLISPPAAVSAPGLPAPTSSATPPPGADFWRQLVRSAPVALHLHRPAGPDEWLNSQLARALGYAPERLPELPALTHPADQPALQAYLARLPRHPGTAPPLELRLRTAAGRWQWYRAQYAAVEPADTAALPAWLGSWQDIAAEKRLAAQNDFHAGVLDSIPAGISIYSPRRRRLYANRRARTDQHLPPEAEFRAALRQRQEVAWEEVRPAAADAPDAPPAHYLRKLLPVPDARGRISHVIGYGVDISRRRAAEQELAYQQELVRQVVDANPQPISVKDETGRFLLVNAAYARLHRRSVAELLAQPPPEDDETHRQEMQLLAAGSSLSTEECHPLPDAPAAWYHTIRQAFQRADGSRYLLSISADVTELKRARVVAEESARSKEVFLANMSHEIRTPMHGVVGLARLLQKTAVTPEQAEYLDLILRNAGNLLVVINDILDFAKMEAGHLELETLPFDVAATVRGLTRSLALVAEGKGLTLRTELPPEPLPTVLGDPVRLSQLLVNLVNNAIKFTPAGSVTVRVELETPPPGVNCLPLRFSVEDTGIGIAPDKREEVFQSFAQASSTTARLYGGTGLGLAICRHLVELQGGSIGLESELGRGSCFYFTLTYAPTAQAPSAVHAAPPPLPPGLLRGLRVLLVEDNPVNQLLACSLLREWQAEATVAPDGPAALRHAQAGPFDLILMDIQMPGMSGLDVTAALRRLPGPNQHTPIVALTANALKADVDTYPHAGFSDWLVKPYHENSLYLVIARNTGRSQEPPLPGLPTPADEPAPAYGFEGLGKLANDPAFIRKLQQLYLDTVPGQLAQLGAALRGHDWPAAAQLAHTLKSTFGNLQIEEALAGTRKIEAALKKNSAPDELLRLYHSVQQTATRTARAFEAELRP